MAGNTAQPGTSVAWRVLAILGAFDSDHRSLTLTDIAERADLSLSTTHRLVAELDEWGCVESAFVRGVRRGTSALEPRPPGSGAGRVGGDCLALPA